jgi:hypothetical protein
MLMPDSLIVAVCGRDPPTLWPDQPHDCTALDLAVHTCEEENRALKVMIVGLSELILGTQLARK